MKNAEKFHEREERAARLKQARIRAGLGGYRKLSQRFGWNENSYKSHEIGRNGFDLADGKRYARAFGVSIAWLMTGAGSPEDIDDAPVQITDVPVVSWVSAGELALDPAAADLTTFRTMPVPDLPAGDWIALRVEGRSMELLAPDGSTIIVNRRDTRLAPGGAYVVADETGHATFKRWNAQEGQFEAFSSLTYPPVPRDRPLTIIGRARRAIHEF